MEITKDLFKMLKFDSSVKKNLKWTVLTDISCQYICAFVNLAYIVSQSLFTILNLP